MIFGIDFDGTFGADPELFHKFLDLIEASGRHKAVIVTARNKPSFGATGWINGQPLVEVVTKGRIPVVYAGSNPKREAALKAGYSVDIWIDDYPFGIDGGKQPGSR